ncbi:MAG: cytochrome c3 family protein [Nitrospirae bacterium]|nr:cytochrome c3 family protein [Nitrospirota bacterium]
MLNPLKMFEQLLTWFNEKVSVKAKIILAVMFLLFICLMGYVAYRINDYFENDPKACITCHVHDDANHAWAVSEHKSVNCHECHHSTKKEQMVQMYRFVFMGVKSVAPRHGEVIVAWKICYSCHWEKNDKFPTAKLMNNSRLHSKHVFMEKIECVKCHGYKIHQFTAEPRFCIKCHEGREVHGVGMEALACLNCHTDRTKDLKPGRKKCLYCHGSEKNRQELLADATLDVTHYKPDDKTVKRATKIIVPENAPMQFDCYQCHKPHKTARPDWGNCKSCHPNTATVGKHAMHIDMGLKCKDCHKPHVWRVTPEQAKKDCVKCHEYKDPKTFISQ